jgi:hypothetical protein
MVVLVSICDGGDVRERRKSRAGCVGVRMG